MNDSDTLDHLTRSIEGREATLAAMYAAADGITPHEDYDDEDQAREGIDNYALSVQPKVTIEVALTIGGPNIYMNVRLDDTLHVEKVTLDGYWGHEEYHKRVTSEDVALMRYAEEQADYYREVNAAHRAGY